DSRPPLRCTSIPRSASTAAPAFRPAPRTRFFLSTRCRRRSASSSPSTRRSSPRHNRGMRTLLSLLVILAASATPPDVAGVNRVLDDWHKAAAGADETRYFGYAAPEFVFLGTDASERWDLVSF